MDTKWNNMDPGKDRGEVSEELRAIFSSERERRDNRPIRMSRGKGWLGFAAFFVGLSLVLYSLGSVGAQLVWERDLTPRFSQDWQETDNFRREVSAYLRDFLTIGAGGQLEFYTASYWEDYNGPIYDEAVTEAIIQSTEGSWAYKTESATAGRAYGSASSASEPDRNADGKEEEPDAAYQNDKNVLYRIETKEGKVYTNNTYSSAFVSRNIEDYNFYLTFQNGKAVIFKDGQELDVYSEGYYHSDSQWFVPGYYNFPSSDELQGLRVYMAVRENPIRYYGVDYQTGGTYSNSSMYYLAQRVAECQKLYRTQAALFLVGVLLLVVWLTLKPYTAGVNRAIARYTARVWTEARVLLVVLWGLWAFWPGFVTSDLFYSLRDGYFWYDGYLTSLDVLPNLVRMTLRNIPALVVFVWLMWLLHNDHRYNPKEARRSLLRPFFRGVLARDLKRPVEKRLSRRAGFLALAAILAAGEMVSILINMTLIGYPSWLLWTVYLLPVLLLAWAAAALARRELGLAKDLQRLSDQVEAVRAGDLETPLDLPEDGDLRKTAEDLNDIQAGMKAALEEQTRSERMKVELVSNVSHDLKTPLTSILSYAELLREEDLPPAAADYARIIGEKAQRLKGMVQDVFEVSKAAADQLPVCLERLDLAKLLRQTLADMDGPIQRSPLTFKVELPEEPVMITADGKRLYRVFQNLLDNTLHYALEGSRVYLSLHVSGGTEEAAGLARVQVRNTSRSELPEGVDFTARFVRGDASRSDGGSGLGLSIAKSFTEACGGTFEIETVADLFTAIVTFPLS